MDRWGLRNDGKGWGAARQAGRAIDSFNKLAAIAAGGDAPPPRHRAAPRGLISSFAPTMVAPSTQGK